MLWKALAGILAGAVGAMGMGGGGVLLLYLTLFAHIAQREAAGINLIFFIPCAVTALICHQKEHKIIWKTALPLAVLGLFGAVAGVFLNRYITAEWLQKLFAVLLLYIGFCEIFPQKKKETQ